MIKIVILVYEYNLDLSHIKIIELDNKVIELDNNKAINELSNMSQKRNLNSHY